MLWRSMKNITLKINGQTFKYEMKIQALKDTSLIKPHYLARFFLSSGKKKNEKWTVWKEWKMVCAVNEAVALTVYYWNWTMLAHI